MPDALSKTVPIWCSVVNRALDERFHLSMTNPLGWDNNLYTPPQSVSRQEHSQVENRLPDWTSSLVVRGSIIHSSHHANATHHVVILLWFTQTWETVTAYLDHTIFFDTCNLRGGQLLSSDLYLRIQINFRWPFQKEKWLRIPPRFRRWSRAMEFSELPALVPPKICIIKGKHRDSLRRNFGNIERGF